MTVRARHLVGRAPEADLRLDALRVSTRHAELYHQEGGWLLRDLGSRNGTTVDGVAVAPGVPVPLSAGSRIAFAGNVWRLVSAGPPRAAAVALVGDGVVEAEDGVITLPGGDAPVAVLAWEHAEGWSLRRGGEERAARDGDVVEAGGRAWRLSLPNALVVTQMSGDALPRADVVLRFEVSRDEEHVSLTVSWGGRTFAPPARAHAYTLVTLARHRLADERAAEIPPSERGWIDQEELCRRLRLDANLLHTHLFRARRQLADAGVPGAEGLVERRLHVGRLRIGYAAIEVVTR